MKNVMGILRKTIEICGVISFLVACLGIANNDGAISIPGFIGVIIFGYLRYLVVATPKERNEFLKK